MYFYTLHKRYETQIFPLNYFSQKKKNPIFQGTSILELSYFINKICGSRSNTDSLELIYFHWIELKIRYAIHHMLLPKNYPFLPNRELMQLLCLPQKTGRNISESCLNSTFRHFKQQINFSIELLSGSSFLKLISCISNLSLFLSSGLHVCSSSALTFLISNNNFLSLLISASQVNAAQST